MARTSKSVAVIGSSFRFPGSESQTFAEALINQKDLITQVDPTRWNSANFTHPDPKNPGTAYTCAAGSLGDVRGFDAAFFGLSPREVVHMDPQQRLLLEMSWEAMENAGYPPAQLRGAKCAVYMGVASIDYGLRYIEDMGAFDQNTGTGTTASIAANRISHLFDLNGPSLVIDTACSSSMVAFHHACESIRRGEVSVALAGGVSLHFHPYGFLAFSKASMLSRQGRCRVFDASADGYVRSEGGGVLLLKDYDQALHDGDRILAVVAGSAANADGYKSALTIPNAKAQVRLMQDAYQAAGITADQITYIEAHGTGTPVGDPIEARAIGEAVGQSRKTPLPIGSVKSNVGHLETASGMAGLAKALTCIERRVIPATIGIKTLNPAIPFTELNLQVVTENQPLPADETITIGINSFGFGGSNAHVILQSPPSVNLVASRAEKLTTVDALTLAVPLCISARSVPALKARAQQLSDQLKATPERLYDIAWTLRYQRERHAQGVWIEGTQAEHISQALDDFVLDKPVADLYPTRFIGDQPAPVFVYSGNGCQWAGMGKALLASSDAFRQIVEEIDQYYQPLAGRSLVELLHTATAETYRETEWAQPALFALQVGITHLLRAGGIEPAAVTGHSVGEVAAAWASGALSLSQAVEVIYHRSHFQGKTAGQGEMTAVAVSEEQMTQILQEHQCQRICIAGVNSAKGITLAGDPTELNIIEEHLRTIGARFKRLDLNYAFHSPVMDPIQSGIEKALANLQPGASQQCRYYSTVTGDQLEGTALTAQYWWENIRKPVSFNKVISALAQQYSVFVEIGAHPVLSGYLKETFKEVDSNHALAIATVSREQADLRAVKLTLASVWGSGATLDWQRFFPVDGQRVELPAYPWQRELYWTPQTPESYNMLNAVQLHPLLGKALPMIDKTWESRLDTQAYPWLSEHQIGEAVLFPGAGFVELALAAAFTQEQRHVLDIEELEIRSPLLLDKSPAKKVRTAFTSDHGHLHIQSADLNSTDPFTVHAKCRVLAETAGMDLLEMAQAFPQRAPDFTRADLNAAARSAELFYGETFQCIADGWIDGDQIQGRVELQGDAAAHHSDYLIHPGILDSAFQLVMALLYLKGDTDVVYVPIQVGRIQWQYSDDAVSQVCVTLKRKLPHSLLMDVRLFDQHGNTLAFLSDVRMRAAVLRHHSAHKIDQWVACLTPMPLPSTEGAVIDLHGCHKKIQRALEQAASYQSYMLEVEPLLDTFAEGSLHALRDNRRELLERLLKRYNLTVSDSPEIDPKEVWFALLRDYPAHFSLVQSLMTLSAENPSPLDIQQRYVQLLRLMLSETAHHHIANILRKEITQFSDALAVGQRLSVLEVSGGDPWWAPWILDQINTQVVDYQCILADAQAQNAASSLQSSLKNKCPELESLTAAQWLERPAAIASVDMAFVTLDFADLSLAKELLQALHQQLRSTGEALVFMHHPAMWLDCALGSAEQWWIADTQTQQASWSQWRELLQRLGFTLLDDDVSTIINTGFYAVRIKRSDNSPKEFTQPAATQHSDALHWILLGSSPTDTLAEHLRHTGSSCTQVESVASLQALLPSLDAQQSHQLVLLPTLLDDTTTQRSTTDDFRVASQPEVHCPEVRCPEVHCPELRCIAIRDIASAVLAHSQLTVKVHCVTHGVAQMFQCDRDDPHWQLEGTTPFLSDDVAVWGFVRTLMNEMPDLAWRLIDVPSQHWVDQGLSTELLSQTDETEVIYSQEGARLAVRFKPSERFEQSEPNEHQALSLGFVLPGQLRNLTWQPSVLSLPAADEVLIEVKATGLNFRDVMYALGLLSDEAIENGYSGPTLGLEFSGEVIAIGSAVHQYQIGDAVVGFGPASFSTQLVAKVTAIAHLPDGMTYEAAATIPTTFFTAWYALKHLAQLLPGERVLIHGAAGGVGIAAIQIAQSLGAEIYATAGSEEKREFLKMLGVEHIFDSRSNVFAEHILQTTSDGEGVDVVLNSLAGESIAQNLRVLKPFGRFLELGKRDFYENTPMGLRPFRNNLSYFGIDSDQLMKVKPALTERVFSEVMERFNSGELFPLPYTLFTAERVEEAFRFMQQARQIGKIVVTYPRPPKPKALAAKNGSTLLLNPKGTYLVSGGLSGFGFRTAQWLVEKGAKSLMLISRSGTLSADVSAQMTQWHAQGIQVNTAACDITDLSALSACIAALDAPAIIGVVHAAAVYADGLAQQLNTTQIESVMRVKTQGALNLHQVTDQLELFVLFSSATTLFGNPGQSHYVAANYWLEAFATWRRQQGSAATCVNWGPIDDVGYLARETQIKDQLNSRLGTDALNSSDALGMLERLILDQRSGIHTLYLDWSSLSRFLPSAQQPKFRVLNQTAQDKGQSGDHQDELFALLEQGDTAAAETLLLAILTTELSNILLMPEERIDATQAIYDLGFDSLMAAELMAAIDTSIGVKLPVMALNDSLTLARLAALILEKLNPNGQTEGANGIDEMAALKAQHGVKDNE